MAASTAVVRGDRFSTLSNHVRDLEDKLDVLHQDYERTYSRYREECISSLRESMESLYEVVKLVNKNDNKIIEWHHRSDKVKVALGFVRLDRRIHALIQKKTQELKDEVQQVESKCDRTNGVFEESVEAADHLKREYLEFSVEAVGGASQEAIQTQSVYEQHRRQLESTIRDHESARAAEERQTRSTSQSLRENKESSRRAKRSQYAWNMGSLGAFAVAAATAGGYALSPFLGAGTLVVLGLSMGGYGYSYVGQVKDLQSQQRELVKELDNHESYIQDLKYGLTSLDKGHRQYSGKLRQIEKLQAKMRTMRVDSQSVIDGLRDTQLVLNKIYSKLADIVDQLEECRFLERRREIGKRLRDIVSLLYEVRKWDIFSSKDEKITKMMRGLAEIDEKTEKVLRIAA